MAVSVQVTVTDNSNTPAPIVGAVVGIFDSMDSTEQAMGTTDIDGNAVFLLPGTTGSGISYEVRVFKLGVRFANPFGIQVQEPVVTSNNFSLTGTLLVLPAATDPTICRCTGRFVDYGNRPLCGVMVRVFNKGDVGEQDPKIVNSNLVSPSAMEFHTDADGNVSLDLFQTGEYYINFAGEEDWNWNILVPARASANLIDLMFPQPLVLTWDQTVAPGNAVTVTIGEELQVPLSILFSDYQNVTTLGRWIQIPVSSNPSIAMVAWLDEPAKVVITGIASGTTNITAELQKFLFPLRVPPYSLTVPPLVVTVP